MKIKKIPLFLVDHLIQINLKWKLMFGKKYTPGWMGGWKMGGWMDGLM